MRIHFRVCADFYDKYGKEIYRVRPADLEGYHDVPVDLLNMEVLVEICRTIKF